MAPGPRKLPALNTLPDLLLTLTAISGEFPTALVSRLPGGDTYKESVVKHLKREKLLRTYYRDSLRGLRLTACAKKLLLADRPERFQPHLTGNSETNAPKSEVPRRLRLHRMAEVLVTMMNTGAAIFPWDKLDLFCPAPPGTCHPIDGPAYYSSREVKEMGPQAMKIRGSRAAGILITDGGIFAAYNTGSFLMKWEYKAELRLKALLQTEVCHQRLPVQFLSAEISGLVFGTGMEPLYLLMAADRGSTRNYFVLDGSYDHFYYLPSDHRGEVILQLLSHPGLRADLDGVLSENLYANRPGWLIENDAMEENEVPVLFAYTCDMPRIQRFDTALELHGRKGTLICFDFQEEMLRRICGQQVTIQSIDFGMFERSALYLQEYSD